MRKVWLYPQKAGCYATEKSIVTIFIEHSRLPPWYDAIQKSRIWKRYYSKSKLKCMYRRITVEKEEDIQWKTLLSSKFQALRHSSFIFSKSLQSSIGFIEVLIFSPFTSDEALISNVNKFPFVTCHQKLQIVLVRNPHHFCCTSSSSSKKGNTSKVVAILVLCVVLHCHGGIKLPN